MRLLEGWFEKKYRGDVRVDGHHEYSEGYGPSDGDAPRRWVAPTYVPYYSSRFDRVRNGVLLIGMLSAFAFGIESCFEYDAESAEEVKIEISE